MILIRVMVRRRMEMDDNSDSVNDDDDDCHSDGEDGDDGVVMVAVINEDAAKILN